jgi:ABC-type Na+ efflux pump permease subunit
VRDFKIDSLQFDRASLENLETEVSIDPESIAKEGADESKYTIGVGLAIGGIMAFIMFFMVMMYGQMVFASMFPLFSPIVLPFRMAFSPPVWQVLLSLVLVTGSSFFFVWMAGRIYRVGILLYGKKVTLMEIGKWLFYR